MRAVKGVSEAWLCTAMAAWHSVLGDSEATVVIVALEGTCKSECLASLSPYGFSGSGSLLPPPRS